MMRRPPSSPLFPSPTLFRSQRPAARTARSAELPGVRGAQPRQILVREEIAAAVGLHRQDAQRLAGFVAEEGEIGRAHSELQSPCNLVCRLLLEKKKNNFHAS